MELMRRREGINHLRVIKSYANLELLTKYVDEDVRLRSGLHELLFWEEAKASKQIP